MWQVGGNEPWVEREMSVVKRCLLPLLLNSLVRSRKRSSDMCRLLDCRASRLLTCITTLNVTVVSSRIKMDGA